MAASSRKAQAFVLRNLPAPSTEALRKRLAPKPGASPRPAPPGGTAATPERVEERWQALGASPEARGALSASGPGPYARNIENFIGTLQVPVGLAGPLRVNGLFAQGD